jgi:hypothetical protein
MASLIFNGLLEGVSMFRLLVGLIAAVCLLLPMTGCGGGDEGSESERTAQTQTPSQAPEGQARQAIPDKEESIEYVEGAFVAPFFDEAGEKSELAVAAGETFTLYIFAEVPEPFHVSAAEFRFDLPAGVMVVDEETFDTRVLTMGNHGSDFQMGFACHEPGKFYLMEYTCRVGDGFKSGDIVITPGVNSAGATYLGFVACQPETRRLPARAGKAILISK